MNDRRLIPRVSVAVGRSLFPVTALAVVGGTLVWGPWVSAVLAYVWWRVVARIG